MSGPLRGLRVIELAPGGAGPAALCAMLLADLGADVLRLRRPGAGACAPGADVVGRSRRRLELDLSQPQAREQALQLVTRADGLVEGLRPGRTEMLGLGPEDCLAANPRLVYARASGWGRQGPLAQAAGEDINHIALSGVLHAIGRTPEPPVAPLNLLGDGAGGLLLAFGVVSALLEAGRSGQGQVVEAAGQDAAALLAAPIWGLRAQGQWDQPRGENRLDSGAHFYDTYACADGRHLAVGALGPRAYAELLERCGIADPLFEAQDDTRAWPMLKGRLARIFLGRTRDEWCSLLAGSAACVSPVLDWDEAPRHPHNLARRAFVDVAGVVQPAPAPRFSRTPAEPPRPEQTLHDGAAALRAWATTDARRGTVRSQPHTPCSKETEP